MKMSVVGLGLEVIDIALFAEQLDDVRSGLSLSAFTLAEQAGVGESQPSAGRRLAARLAAKLAFLKALSASDSGAAMMLESPDLAEIEVIKDSFGRPSLRLGGEVARVAQVCIGSNWIAHVSMTHEGNHAAAVVVIEKSS
jgi:holo-[acyl-carrier protein] synthase